MNPWLLGCLYRVLNILLLGPISWCWTGILSLCILSWVGGLGMSTVSQEMGPPEQTDNDLWFLCTLVPQLL